MRTMRGVELTCEQSSFLLNSNSSWQVIHYSVTVLKLFPDVAYDLKLFYLQDLKANLQQVREYDGNRLSIVFLQLYEDPFEWKIAWRTSKIKLHRRPEGFGTKEGQIADSGGQGQPCTASLEPAYNEGRRPSSGL